MGKHPIDNVVPLVNVTIDHRNRLIMRARQSEVSDAIAINSAVTRIDRWLIEFAYPRGQGRQLSGR